MAFGCGIRVLVRRNASPLLHDYVMRQHLCDYITAHTPERNAVREVCELLLGLLGSFDAVVASRVAWDDDYARYFAERQAVATELIDPRRRLGRAARDRVAVRRLSAAALRPRQPRSGAVCAIPKYWQRWPRALRLRHAARRAAHDLGSRGVGRRGALRRPR